MQDPFLFEQVYDWPSPGSVISIPFLLVYRHRGIVSDRFWNGKPTVISNSVKNGMVEESWDQFLDGNVWKGEGYPGQLPYYEVLARARFCRPAPYHLTRWNCDHFVKYAHGLPLQSEQVTATMAICTLAGIIFATKVR